jgi:hypothetical protein
MALWLAAIGGEMINLDHSFKASKRILDATGEQQFAAVLTLMNEFCQVRFMCILYLNTPCMTWFSCLHQPVTCGVIPACADPCHHSHWQQVPVGGQGAAGGLHGKPGEAGCEV